MRKVILTISILAIVFSCKKKTSNIVPPQPEVANYMEPYRPQYHFSPQEKWMNDPNGLVFNEGVYHLFYQYYPDDIVWGPMHWGHATSKDMISWEHKPIALYPDEHGLIFSGSAVVDKNNTSGFATNGETPLVAVFTYHLMEGEQAGRKDFQTQGIAYSLDNGENWTKYEGNPVIGNKDIKDFRDPKVFWHEASQSWIMALVAGDHAKFYRSENLKEWKHISDFGKFQGAHGGVWECPDLFQLKVEGTDEKKWVLIISINPGAPNGGSGTQYFIGEFDGTTFKSNQKEAKWLDFGTDNYAGVTYNNVPNNDRIFIGWMSNWDYARNTPTEKWRSAMTVPRKLSLRNVNGDYLLTNYPLEGLNNLHGTSLAQNAKVVGEGSQNLEIENLNQTEMVFQSTSKDFKLTWKNNLNETLELTMDNENKLVLLDRMNSGKVDFQSEFGNKKHHMPIDKLGDGPFEVRVLMDWSSIEVFIDDGLYVMTAQIFPSEPYDQLLLENRDSESSIDNINVRRMKSIW